ERRTEERPKPDRVVHHNGEGKADRHLQRDDSHRVDQRVPHRVLPEDAVVVELTVVVEAHERSAEDAPVVAADVRGVADREDEEEQKEGHRKRDEAVAHHRLTQALRPQAPHLPLLRDRHRHVSSPVVDPLPRHLQRCAGEQANELGVSYFAAAAIFASISFTVSLPWRTAVSSLFATSVQTWRKSTWFPQPCVNCGYFTKAPRPATGLTSLRAGSAKPSEVHFFAPVLPVR